MNRTALSTLLLAGAALTTPVAARAAEPAVCHVEVHATARPGVWATRPTDGSTSQTTPGTIVCAGTIAGRRLSTAPGAFTMTFSFGSRGPGPSPVRDTDCVHGWTAGQWSASIPAADGGIVEIAGPFAGAWTGLAWRADGRLGQHVVTAVGQTRGDPDYPSEDCVTKPFEHFIDSGQLSVR